MKKDIKQYIEDIRSDSKKATTEAVKNLIPIIKKVSSMTNDISELYENMFPEIGLSVDYYEDSETFEPQEFICIYKDDNNEEYFIFNKYRTDYYFPIQMVTDTDKWLDDHKENTINIVKEKIEYIIKLYQKDIDTHNQEIEECKTYINKLKEQLKNI